jgi:hypothetical protein
MELVCVSAVDSDGRTIWIADAHRGDGKRFVVQADELLTAFVELESVIRAAERPEDCRARTIKLDNCRANQVKASWITSSDSFNVSSARLNKPQGLDLRRDTV